MGTVAAAVRDHDQRVQQPPTICLRGSSSRCPHAVEPPPPVPATFLKSGVPQAGQCLNTLMTAVAARSVLRSRRRRRRRAPRLASCLIRTGPGSREFLAPTTRRLRGICHLPRAVLVPLDQDLAADAKRRLPPAESLSGNPEDNYRGASGLWHFSEGQWHPRNIYATDEPAVHSSPGSSSSVK